LDYEDNCPLAELENEAEPTDWRVLPRSFNNLNMKTLFVANGVVEKPSRSLESDDGEYPDDLLPELQELAYSPSNDNADAFREFIDTRQNAGHPVTLDRLKDIAPNAPLSRGS
jgi:hypothetical protein